MCNIKVKSSLDHSIISNYVKKKGYTIKHFSINKGNLEEVFQDLTYSKR